jgi:hypothetical protein
MNLSIGLELEVTIEGEFVKGSEYYWDSREQRTEPAIADHIDDMRVYLKGGQDITSYLSEDELGDIEQDVIERIREPREEV